MTSDPEGSLPGKDAGSLEVLVLAPVGRDASAAAQVLRQRSIEARVCTSLPDLLESLEREIGAVLLAEEALFGRPLEALASRIAAQEAWSDLPFIVLASNQELSAIAGWRHRLVKLLRNVSLLDRPVHGMTLVSAVQSALRARTRQYEVRMHLRDREQAARDLEALVRVRTAELAATNARLRAEIAGRESAEETLRQVQKMEAVGQLTGGIAHDFNNMLQGIGGSLELMQRRIDQDRLSEIPFFIDAARKTVQRAAMLTNRLLAFARRQALQPRSIQVDTLVFGMGELVRGTIGPAIDLHLVLSTEPNAGPSEEAWPVLCDPSQLENVLLNVAINARDAMPDGGRLTITTAHASMGAADMTAQDGAGPGDYVEITIADTGAGMDERTRQRVFEPFFTTKPLGKGTGLGLSQLYGFIRQSGGFVRLESEPGQGTTLRLYLPRHSEAPQQESAPATQEPMVGQGVILLVEDQQDVRAMTAEWLRDLGYQVLEAVDGPAGLQILATATRLDLLVTDVGLPNGLNGRQVADAARERHADLPVLFITGFAGAVLKERLAPGMEVIGKPFTLNALASRIGAMLKRPNAGSPGSCAS